MNIEGSIKVLDEIAEGFENLSAEVCARNDLRALWEGRAKGIRQAITVIKANLRGNPNAPLSVVHCKDCKHLYFKDFSAFCPHKVSACRPDGFCEYGERCKPEEESKCRF